MDFKLVEIVMFAGASAGVLLALATTVASSSILLLLPTLLNHVAHTNKHPVSRARKEAKMTKWMARNMQTIEASCLYLKVHFLQIFFHLHALDALSRTILTTLLLKEKLPVSNLAEPPKTLRNCSWAQACFSQRFARRSRASEQR